MPDDRQSLTQEFVRSILDYDPGTGVFTWRVRRGVPAQWNTRFANRVAGNVANGRRGIRINGLRYYASRLAWLYVHNEWPAPEIDHRNVLSADDSIGNLRPATRSQNLCNTRIRSDNKSGVKGVSWNSRAQKWVAQIRRDSVTTYLGLFMEIDAAAAAYIAAAQKHHGDFMRTG